MRLQQPQQPQVCSVTISRVRLPLAPTDSLSEVDDEDDDDAAAELHVVAEAVPLRPDQPLAVDGAGAQQPHSHAQQLSAAAAAATTTAHVRGSPALLLQQQPGLFDSRLFLSCGLGHI